MSTDCVRRFRRYNRSRHDNSISSASFCFRTRTILVINLRNYKVKSYRFARRSWLSWISVWKNLALPPPTRSNFEDHLRVEDALELFAQQDKRPFEWTRMNTTFECPRTFHTQTWQTWKLCWNSSVGYGSTERILEKREKYLKVEDVTMKTMHVSRCRKCCNQNQ